LAQFFARVSLDGLECLVHHKPSVNRV
jgi:hypothetical protein